MADKKIKVIAQTKLNHSGTLYAKGAEIEDTEARLQSALKTGDVKLASEATQTDTTKK